MAVTETGITSLVRVARGPSSAALRQDDPLFIPRFSFSRRRSKRKRFLEALYGPDTFLRTWLLGCGASFGWCSLQHVLMNGATVPRRGSRSQGRSCERRYGRGFLGASAKSQLRRVAPRLRAFIPQTRHVLANVVTWVRGCPWMARHPARSHERGYGSAQGLSHRRDVLANVATGGSALGC
jgi:hypothetical protein